MIAGIVYATRREAAPFLSLTSAQPLATQPFALFRTATGHHGACITVISGMGKVAATLAATHLVLVQRVKLLINAGLCGRLTADNRWPIGSLLRISTAVEGDCDRFGKAESAVPCDSRWFTHLESARLVTSDRPVFSNTRRGELSAVADLADMEGAAVARVAQCYGVPCVMIKGISDTASETGRKDVGRHLEQVSAVIAEALVNELKTVKTDQQS